VREGWGTHEKLGYVPSGFLPGVDQTVGHGWDEGLFRNVASRRDGRIIIAVFQVKKKIPVEGIREIEFGGGLNGQFAVGVFATISHHRGSVFFIVC
jgi:hypothetical protein